MIKLRNRITAVVQFLIVWSIFCNAPASANPLTFTFEDTNPNTHEIVDMLKELGVFDKLQTFVELNLRLKKTVTFSLNSGPGRFFDGKQNKVTIPYAFLHETYDDLAAKYQHQPEVARRIFASTIEQMLWFELGRSLISQYALPILGREEYTLDTFATLMLLNLSDEDSDYLLDAAEEFLLIDKAVPLLNNSSMQNEMAFDENRYRNIVCMVLGKDNEPYPRLLEKLAWDQAHLNQCSDFYRNKLNAWHQALAPFLKTNNQLRRWQEALSPPNPVDQDPE